MLTIALWSTRLLLLSASCAECSASNSGMDYPVTSRVDITWRWIDFSLAGWKEKTSSYCLARRLEQQQQERQQQQLWTPRPFQSVPPLLPSIYPSLLPHPHRFSYPLAPREPPLLCCYKQKLCLARCCFCFIFKRRARQNKRFRILRREFRFGFSSSGRPRRGKTPAVPLVNQSLEYSHSSWLSRPLSTSSVYLFKRKRPEMWTHYVDIQLMKWLVSSGRRVPPGGLISTAGPACSNKRRLHAEMIAARKNRAAHTWVASVFVDWRWWWPSAVTSGGCVTLAGSRTDHRGTSLTGLKRPRHLPPRQEGKNGQTAVVFNLEIFGYF